LLITGHQIDWSATLIDQPSLFATGPYVKVGGQWKYLNRAGDRPVIRSIFCCGRIATKLQRIATLRRPSIATENTIPRGIEAMHIIRKGQMADDGVTRTAAAQSNFFMM